MPSLSAPLTALKRLFHGGVYTPEQPIRGVLYATDNPKMAETYVDMYRDRFGGNPSVLSFLAELKSRAPEQLVKNRAEFFGIPYEDYTPASAFDRNLHGSGPVDSLITSLLNSKYDHAILEDMPYGYGRGGPDIGNTDAYVLLPNVRPRR